MGTSFKLASSVEVKVFKNTKYEKKCIKEENLEGSGTQIKIKKKENSEEKKYWIMVGCEYPGEGAIYFNIIDGQTQDLDLFKMNFCNHHLIESVSFLHTAVKDLLNQNFLSQQIESASCIEVQAFI